MLVRMAQVEIVGPARRLQHILAVLHRLRAVEIVDVRDVPDLHIDPLPVEPGHAACAESLARLRARLDAMLALLPKDGVIDGARPPDGPPVRSDGSAESEDGWPDALAAELDGIEPRVRELVKQIDDLRHERDALPRHLESIERMLPLLPELVELESYDTVVLMLDRRHAGLLDVLQAELTHRVGARHDVVSAAVDRDTVGAVVVFPRSVSERIDAWLGQEDVSQVPVPTGFEGLPIKVAIARMRERLAGLPALIARAERDLWEVLTPHVAGMLAGRHLLDAAIDRMDAATRAGTLGHVAVVVGWTPRAELSRLRAALARALGPEVVVAEIPLDRGAAAQAPLLMRNRRPARPFEFLVRLLSLPRAGTIDPTSMMSLFLPLFFGMMLGDVAYGIVLLFVALVVRRRLGRRSQFWRDLGAILVMGSAWAIVWGVLYGEVLGDLGRRLGLHAMWLDRERALVPLLVFAVAVGATHVVLGLLLGVWTAWKERRRGLLAERGGMLLAMAGLFLVVGLAAQRLPGAMLTPAIAAMVVGLALVIAPQGWIGLLIGPIEVLGAFGNVLSYLRIAAIGLASVYLARMANEMTGLGAPIWLGVLIATLLHGLNIALGAFSPMIQSLRLHYVEFFGKFYEGGGRAFRPFGGAVAPGAAGP